MIARTARASDAPALRALWEECFHDPQEYIGFFFEERFCPEQTLLIEQDETPVSMLFLLEGGICAPDSKQISALYIYAACTHPAYRRRGMMEQLLRFAREQAVSRQIDCLTLLPSSSSLYAFYAQSGFEPFFFHRTLTVSRQALGARWLSQSPDPIIEVDTAQAAGLRNKALADTAYFAWNGPAVVYAWKEHALAGGQKVCTPYGYALYAQDAGQAFVQEFVVCPGRESGLVNALLSVCDADSFIVWGAGSNAVLEQGSLQRWGMMLPLSTAAARMRPDAYLGLALS